MSGGSMDYLYSKVEWADFRKDTPLRIAFATHLKLVAKALHDIEWVDSGDYGEGDENGAIRECLGDSLILKTIIAEAKKSVDALNSEIERIEKK